MCTKYTQSQQHQNDWLHTFNRRHEHKVKATDQEKKIISVAHTTSTTKRISFSLTDPAYRWLCLPLFCISVKNNNTNTKYKDKLITPLGELMVFYFCVTFVFLEQQLSAHLEFFGAPTSWETLV